PAAYPSGHRNGRVHGSGCACGEPQHRGVGHIHQGAEHARIARRLLPAGYGAAGAGRSRSRDAGNGAGGTGVNTITLISQAPLPNSAEGLLFLYQYSPFSFSRKATFSRKSVLSLNWSIEPISGF